MNPKRASSAVMRRRAAGPLAWAAGAPEFLGPVKLVINRIVVQLCASRLRRLNGTGHWASQVKYSTTRVCIAS